MILKAQWNHILIIKEYKPDIMTTQNDGHGRQWFKVKLIKVFRPLDMLQLLRTPLWWSCVILLCLHPPYVLWNGRHKRRFETLIQKSLPIESWVKTLIHDTCRPTNSTSKSARGVSLQQSFDQLMKMRAEACWIWVGGQFPLKNHSCSSSRTLTGGAIQLASWLKLILRRVEK